MMKLKAGPAVLYNSPAIIGSFIYKKKKEEREIERERGVEDSVA